MLNTLEDLIKLARDRKSTPVEGSYTNKLLTDKSLSKAKVLEEVNELIEASINSLTSSKTFALLKDLSVSNLLVYEPSTGVDFLSLASLIKSSNVLSILNSNRNSF